MRIVAITLALAVCLANIEAHATTENPISIPSPISLPPMQRIDAPPTPSAIPLLPNGSAASLPETWYRVADRYMVRNVSRPTLTPFLPDPAKATGTAVIVAPGGAFMALSLGHEGDLIAERLAEVGITAFVLKYRLNETPADEPGFFSFMKERMGETLAMAKTGQMPDHREPRATEDALAAVKLVRANAKQWGIDPNKVGMLGFSSGAAVSIQAAITSVAADRPNFIAPFYPPLVAVKVPPQAPPMFAAFAFDDEYFGKQEMGLVEAWRKSGAAVEFHAYEKGGHGFRLGRPGTTTDGVFGQFLSWLELHDLGERAAPAAPILPRSR